jgi:hypothetical protein
MFPKFQRREITDEADAMFALGDDYRATNPNFIPGDDLWGRNCSHTSTALEMRRRGYDVEATSRDPAGSKSRAEIAALMIDPDTALPRAFERLSQKEAEALAKSWPVGARGQVIVDWKGGKSAHILNVEKMPDGKVWLNDGQPGERHVDWADGESGSLTLPYAEDVLEIRRVDDLVIQASNIEAWVKPKGSA